jgi:hypothetical protein
MPVRTLSQVTAEDVKKAVSYDPETGAFTRNATGKISGSRNSKGYIDIHIVHAQYKAHRLAWLIMTGEWPSSQIDHINGDKSDNRWRNLREATNSQNNANQGLRRSNRTGFKGVSFARNGKPYAQIRANGQTRYLGSFDTAEEASAAYEKAAKEAFGEFARVA